MDETVKPTGAADGTTWHALGVGEVLKRLGTSIDKGLGASEAQNRLQEYGANRLPVGKKRGPLVRFFSQLNNILVYVLLGAGFTKMMLGVWLDAWIILGVVLLNALLGFIQEGKAEKSTVGDRESMVFSGTMVVSGRATGVVVATGSQTELGKINQLLASVSSLETPLLRQIKRLGYLVTAVVGIVGVLVFAYGRWVMGKDFVELFQAVVGIAVSLIPEGLPALITITLAIGVQRMAQRNAIIRRLPAVETLGSVSRICSDKTGTLTLMEMMVVSAATAEKEFQVSGNGYAPEGEVKA